MTTLSTLCCQVSANWCARSAGHQTSFMEFWSPPDMNNKTWISQKYDEKIPGLVSQFSAKKLLWEMIQSTASWLLRRSPWMAQRVQWAHHSLEQARCIQASSTHTHDNKVNKVNSSWNWWNDLCWFVGSTPFEFSTCDWTSRNGYAATVSFRPFGPRRPSWISPFGALLATKNASHSQHVPCPCLHDANPARIDHPPFPFRVVRLLVFFSGGKVISISASSFAGLNFLL